MAPRPQFTDSVEIAPGHDVDELSDRFEIFEALHHTMAIANPMSSGELDEVVDMLAPNDGDTVLDIACGYGELLVRLALTATVTGIGIDLSPWMIAAASTTAAERVPDAELAWRLADGRQRPEGTFDRTVCLGASWIWHGFAGTAREVAASTAPGGRLAIGDMSLRDGLDASVISAAHGRVMSIDEEIAAIEAHGCTILGRVDTTDAAWDDYLERSAIAVRRWAELHPGSRANSFIEEHGGWSDDQERDRSILNWRVWVAEKAA